MKLLFRMASELTKLTKYQDPPVLASQFTQVQYRINRIELLIAHKITILQYDRGLDRSL